MSHSQIPEKVPPLHRFVKSAVLPGIPKSLKLRFPWTMSLGLKPFKDHSHNILEAVLQLLNS